MTDLNAIPTTNNTHQPDLTPTPENPQARSTLGRIIDASTRPVMDYIADLPVSNEA